MEERRWGLKVAPKSADTKLRRFEISSQVFRPVFQLGREITVSPLVHNKGEVILSSHTTAWCDLLHAS